MVILTTRLKLLQNIIFYYKSEKDIICLSTTMNAYNNNELFNKSINIFDQQLLTNETQFDELFIFKH